MTLSSAIRFAVVQTFPPEQHQQVLAALETIPEQSDHELLRRPQAEEMQAAVLMLAWGDIDIFEGQLMNACVEPRDVIYALQSPSVVKDGLDCDELVRRYQKCHLPVHRVLTQMS